VVQDSIAQARARGTTILVAHCLSTLRDADRIAVFDQGHIVETGTFAELEAGNGLFSRLVHSSSDSRAE
jgi:ABC-type multidrug transport system fused ATPase/permease subunit